MIYVIMTLTSRWRQRHCPTIHSLMFISTLAKIHWIPILAIINWRFICLRFYEKSSVCLEDDINYLTSIPVHFKILGEYDLYNTLGLITVVRFSLNRRIFSFQHLGHWNNFQAIKAVKEISVCWFSFFINFVYSFTFFLQIHFLYKLLKRCINKMLFEISPPITRPLGKKIINKEYYLKHL